MTTTDTELAPPTPQEIVIGNTLPELKKLAKALGIRGFSKMKKQTLLMLSATSSLMNGY